MSKLNESIISLMLPIDKTRLQQLKRGLKKRQPVAVRFHINTFNMLIIAFLLRINNYGKRSLVIIVLKPSFNVKIIARNVLYCISTSNKK